MSTKARARALRQNQTEAEKRLWSKLRNRQLDGFKFYRQYPVPPYYADFLCRAADLVIEVDGGQHCENRRDDERTEFLESQGYTVMRFWNNDILGNTEGVLLSVQERLRALTPTLSLKGEGEEPAGCNKE